MKLFTIISLQIALSAAFSQCMDTTNQGSEKSDVAHAVASQIVHEALTLDDSKEPNKQDHSDFIIQMVHPQLTTEQEAQEVAALEAQYQE